MALLNPLHVAAQHRPPCSPDGGMHPPSFVLPLQVIPRTATWLNQSEQWLQPALNYLQDRIQIR